MTRRKLLRPQMCPRQIRRIKRRVNIHIRLHLTGHQLRKRHDRRSRLVPQWQTDLIILHQPRIRIITSRDAIQHALREILLVRYVASDGDGGEGSRDGNVGGFGIDEEVDVGANVLGEGGLELVEVEVDVAAHDDEFFGGAGEGAVEAGCEGDVG